MLVKRIVRDPGDASRALLFTRTFCSLRLYRPTIRPTLERAGWPLPASLFASTLKT